MSWLERTELLVGKEKLAKLHNSNVLIVGLGGVGAYAAEQICRAGVGNMTIIDADLVHESNLNRQLAALQSTLLQPKASVMASRLLDINPDLNLKVYAEFLRDQRTEEILLSQKFDYVIDAIDTLSPKINLIIKSLKLKIPLVSSMGAGGKFDPSQVQIADISKSYNDMLARMLRKRLHKYGIYSGFKVIFSPEEIDKSKVVLLENEQNKKSAVGTISFMPAVFGIFAASVVINSILES
jgi:tRNA A37 threonylcarbamoyladenosine dehydratase